MRVYNSIVKGFGIRGSLPVTLDIEWKSTGGKEMWKEYMVWCMRRSM